MTRTVLVVDDEPDIRAVAEISLGRVGGWDVICAASGSEAVQLAASTQPDAVLLDVMMPEMDGPTTLAALRAREATQDLPVLLLTAKVGRSEVAELEALDVSGVLGKPFDPMTLPDQVAAALGWETEP